MLMVEWYWGTRSAQSSHADTWGRRKEEFLTRRRLNSCMRTTARKWKGDGCQTVSRHVGPEPRHPQSNLSFGVPSFSDRNWSGFSMPVWDLATSRISGSEVLLSKERKSASEHPHTDWYACWTRGSSLSTLSLFQPSVSKEADVYRSVVWWSSFSVDSGFGFNVHVSFAWVMPRICTTLCMMIDIQNSLFFCQI